MARSVGRNLVVRRVVGGAPVTIAAIRTKSLSIGSEPIDVTTDDDSGWRRLLDEPGQRQLDLSFSGVTEDDLLIGLLLDGTPASETINLLLPSGATIEGSFVFTSLSLTGEYNQGTTFEGEMQSSGALTFTGAS